MAVAHRGSGVNWQWGQRGLDAPFLANNFIVITEVVNDMPAKSYPVYRFSPPCPFLMQTPPILRIYCCRSMLPIFEVLPF